MWPINSTLTCFKLYEFSGLSALFFLNKKVTCFFETPARKIMPQFSHHNQILNGTGFMVYIQQCELLLLLSAKKVPEKPFILLLYEGQLGLWHLS